MAYESIQNLKTDGTRFVEGQDSLYLAMMITTFMLIDIEIRGGVELLAYVIIQRMYTSRLLSFNPFTNQYSVANRTINMIGNFFTGIIKIVIILISISRLLMPFFVEMMIMI